MRAVEEGRLSVNSASFENHIDRCLGCRACEPVCPAGVEYGQLLEGARAELFKAGEKHSVTQKLLRFALRHVWLRPSRLTLAFTFARLARDTRIVRLLLKSKLPRLISRRFEFALALLESSSPHADCLDAALMRPGSLSGKRAAKGGHTGPPLRQSVVLLFTGCVTEGLFSRVNRATARVLEVNGFATRAPAKQGCCGALHAHAGDIEGARQLARQNLEAFSDDGALRR